MLKRRRWRKKAWREANIAKGHAQAEQGLPAGASKTMTSQEKLPHGTTLHHAAVLLFLALLCGEGTIPQMLYACFSALRDLLISMLQQFNFNQLTWGMVSSMTFLYAFLAQW